MATLTNGDVEPEVKKRRGRKPKEVKVEVINAKVNIIDSLNVSSKQTIEQVQTPSTDIVDVIKAPSNEVIDEGKEPKKGRRGRKPKYVYTAFENTSGSGLDDNNISNGNQEDENVIVRLNVSSDITNSSVMTNEVSNSNIDEQPYAYNHDTYNNISNIADILSSQEDNSNERKTKSESNSKVVNVLSEFAEKNKNNEWPINTSTHCYWCVHRFQNAPFGIPISYKDGKFDVFGCFCSLECAAAHNFNENKSQDEMWERYQLINMMSRQMNLEKIVKSAPPRLSLKVFGGNMDIETFRGVGKSNKLMNVNFPPMASIIQQLEEINDFEISNDFKYIPVDDDRINKYKEKITFKRNKPLIDKNKSLESSMNLKFSN